MLTNPVVLPVNQHIAPPHISRMNLLLWEKREEIVCFAVAGLEHLFLVPPSFFVIVHSNGKTVDAYKFLTLLTSMIFFFLSWHLIVCYHLRIWQAISICTQLILSVCVPFSINSLNAGWNCLSVNWEQLDTSVWHLPELQRRQSQTK